MSTPNKTPAQIWQEREDVIVNGIMSANNACATLKTLAENALKGDAKPLDDFVRGRVRAVMGMIAQEDYTEDADFAEVRRSEENKRQLCEFVVSNVGAGITVEPHVAGLFRQLLAAALPGHPFLT